MAATVRLQSYGLHKATGRGFVKLKGKFFYLGKHGTTESQEWYRRLVADYLAGRPLPGETPADGVAVADLLDRYQKPAWAYYTKGGRPTSAVVSIHYAVRFVRDKFGATPAGQFDFLALRAVRDSLNYHRIPAGGILVVRQTSRITSRTRVHTAPARTFFPYFVIRTE